MQSSQKRRAAKDGETRYNSADATPAWLSKVRGVRKTGEGKEGSHRKCTSEKKKKEKRGISKGVLLLPSTHGGIFARKSSEEVNVQNVIFFHFFFGKNMIQPFFGEESGTAAAAAADPGETILLEKQKGVGTTFSPFLPRLRLGGKV